MLYSEIIPICSETHTKDTNSLFGQNMQLFNIKTNDTQNNR